MIAVAALAALLAAEPAPGLPLHSPALDPTVPRLADRGPFAPAELFGASAGIVVGDAAVIGLATGAYELVTHHAVAPTVGNFRLLGSGLALAALVLPPLGAMIGAKLAGVPGNGAAWKAFLLSLLGHAAALVTGFYSAPSFWPVLAVQLAVMSTGASLGLHWGPAPHGAAHAPAARPAGEPVEPAPAAAMAWARPMCPDAVGD